MNDSRRLWFTIATVVLCAAVASAAMWYLVSPRDRVQAPAARLTPGNVPSADPPLPALTQSPFLNTRPDARYVGAEACYRCHPEAHRSYASSAMSRSMAEIDPQREPPDTVFEHSLSGRKFSVYRQDGKLRQRETLTGVGDGEETELADHSLRFVVGSGHFSRTYFAEVDGFLVEAPLTWYAATRSWGMSPGYDTAAHPGFSRPATERCVSCHAGHSELVDGSLHRHRIHELAIGCERCHGPGSVHVDFRQCQPGDAVRSARPDEIDYTIVNPAHLPRHLAEAICQQCHLTAAAEVVARGRDLSEYRPGLPLQEYLQFFRRSVPEISMTVVGHSEQLEQSPCYQQSETLTCLTCHNPHQTPAPEQRSAYYRTICLDCHQMADCRVDPAVREFQSSDNDCTHCHMPIGPTDIIHLAFTHHRIGIHSPRQEPRQEPPAGTGELEPLLDLSHLAESDRLRSLGLAHFEYAARDGGRFLKAERQPAQRLLESVRGSGLSDGQVTGSLAQIFGAAGDPQAPVFAAETLEDSQLPPAIRAGAMSILADHQFRKGQTDEAADLAHELIRLRRNAADWILLGNCELKREDYAAATRAFEHAVSIDPGQVAVHRMLSRLQIMSGTENDDVSRRRMAIASRIAEILNAANPATPTSDSP